MTDAPKTPEQIVDYARLTAQRLGKVMLPEMMAHLDEIVSGRCGSMRAWIKEHGADNVDLETWGRRTHVLDALFSFLERIDSDEEARDYLVRRFRRGVIRNDISMDGGGSREAAPVGGEGAEIG